MLLNTLFILLAVFLLGFCIFIHELGHFLAARRRGLKVERFSIGFGPPIVRWERNGVDYRISWIPFGGYVALPQLADMGRLEGGEESEEAGLPPISYADKMIVAVMGAVFNLIFALILSCVLWIIGQDIVVSTEIDRVLEEVVSSDNSVLPGPAFVAGLRPGDRITAIDGDSVDTWRKVERAILTGTGRNEKGEPEVIVEVLREDTPLSFVVNPVLISREASRDIGIIPEGDLHVSGVVTGMPASSAGMMPGDVLHQIEGKPLTSSAILSKILASHEAGPIDLAVLRNGQPVTLSIEPKWVEDAGTKQFGFLYGYLAKTERVHLNPIEQLSFMAETVKRTLYALLHKGSDVKVRNMQGPIGIVDVISIVSHYGPAQVMWLLAFINVNLAILNLLPVPVLDGGHMLFATISKLSGKQLPRRFLEVTQGAFVILFLTFMLYVTFFDLGRIGHRIGFGEDSEPPTAEEALEEPKESGSP
ncbi:MAG: RIP metalloprotease RseP [Verrucomicrobiota bacterium]